MALTHRRLVPVLLSACLLGGVLAGCNTSTKEEGLTLTEPSQVIFHDQMRKLWEDHVTWTRLAIVQFAADAPGLGATNERLFQNQADIGDAIRPYYGAFADDKLTTLLTQHITVAVDILKAAKAKDQGAMDNATALWYANASDIAHFLAGANKQWPEEEILTALEAHLTQTLGEAAAEINGDYEASVKAYEVAHVHILGLADMLSTGIMEQFPDKFNG